MESSAYESSQQGKSLRVYLVNPPLEDPWRTHGDYQKEQEEARSRHQLLLEQHQILVRQQTDFQKTLRWSMWTSVGTLVIAIGTLWMAYNATNASKADNIPQTPIQEITSAPASNEGGTKPDK